MESSNWVTILYNSRMFLGHQVVSQWNISLHGTLVFPNSPIDHPESTQVQDVQQIRKYKSLG